MTLADTYRRRLRGLAYDQYGYVTTRDADELDIPPVELRRLAGEGVASKHVGRGRRPLRGDPQDGPRRVHGGRPRRRPRCVRHP
ncbi:MAG: hypothetical protein U5R31_11005 [Acidimicrobiia bacterium]|nr:hypothetical protein [Acidimicrobiia bacterium]